MVDLPMIPPFENAYRATLEPDPPDPLPIGRQILFAREAKAMRRLISKAAAAMILAAHLFAAGCGSTESSSGEVAASINSSDIEGADESAAKTPKVQAPPTVRIDTTAGSMTLVLDPAKAPLTVRNFLAYVNDGHYDGTIFHQVFDGYMILGGGFDKDLQEKSARDCIRNEAHNGLSNRRGAIAMARQIDAIDSSTCQFFINLGDNPQLDHHDRETAEGYGYCVFGQITEGLEVAEKIGKMPVRDIEGFAMIPVQPVVIRSVKRLY